MVQRYTLDTLDLHGIEYVEDAYVELDYKGAPTSYELEKEIQSGVHTNVDGEVGCPMCSCVDMFYREFNTKGRRYRCNSCFYNSESQFESVKSKKDITLSSYGLVYVCDICGEEMDSYNKATVLRHIKKHEDDNKVSEAEGEEALYWASRTNMRDAENELEVPRYVYHATPQKYWEEIQQQGEMIPQIGYMTYRAFLPRYRNERFEAGLDITPEDYKEWLTAEIGGHKIWATSQQKSSMYGSMIEPMSLLEDNAILQIDTTGLNFEYYGYEEYFTNDPIPLSSIEHLYFMAGERYGEEYPDYLLFELSPEYDDTVEDDEELADLLHDKNFERFLMAAEDYEIRRWLKVLRDEDPDEIDWPDWDDAPPHKDDWQDSVDWRAERTQSGVTPEQHQKWIDNYEKRRKQWDYEATLPSKPYADYPSNDPIRIANKRRLRQGGLFLNWLKTFGGLAGYRRQCHFFNIVPAEEKPLTRATTSPYDYKPRSPQPEHPYTPWSGNPKQTNSPWSNRNEEYE